MVLMKNIIHMELNSTKDMYMRLRIITICIFAILILSGCSKVNENVSVFLAFLCIVNSVVKEYILSVTKVKEVTSIKRS